MIVSARLFRRITLMAMLCGPVALAADGPGQTARRTAPAARGGGGQRAERCITLDSADAAVEVSRGLRLLLKHHPQGSDVMVGGEGDGVVCVMGDSPLADALFGLVLAPMGQEVGVEPAEAAPEKAPRPDQPRARRELPWDELAVRVFELSYADAGVVSDFVEMLKVGSRTPWATAHDERTNSIIVKGSPELIEEAAALIEQLDRPTDRVAQGPKVVKLMPLSHAEAAHLANVVAEVLDLHRRGAAPAFEIVADAHTNTIVLAGPEDQLAPAIELIRRLDTPSGDSQEPKAKEAPAEEIAPAPQPPGRLREGRGAPAPRAARERPGSPKAPTPAPAEPGKPKGGPRPAKPPAPEAPPPGAGSETPPAPPEHPTPPPSPEGTVGTPAR